MRRREIDVWPAMTDVMSSFAVVGLAMALTLHLGSRDLLSMEEANALRAEVEALKVSVAALEREKSALEQENEALSRMQEAVEVAEDVMRELARAPGARVSEDLTVTLGEDIVRFKTSEVEPVVSMEGGMRINGICAALREALDAVDPNLGVPRRDIVQVVIEGHSDSEGCSGDPRCNWRFSAGRAAAFGAKFIDVPSCRGPIRWDIRPVGLADTRLKGTPEESRRIEIRVEPRYGELLALIEAAGRKP